MGAHVVKRYQSHWSDIFLFYNDLKDSFTPEQPQFSSWDIMKHPYTVPKPYLQKCLFVASNLNFKSWKCIFWKLAVRGVCLWGEAPAGVQGWSSQIDGRLV